MNAKEIAKVFAESFSRLTKQHLRNFRWHLEKGTPVCCGDDWLWFARKGAG